MQHRQIGLKWTFTYRQFQWCGFSWNKHDHTGRQSSNPESEQRRGITSIRTWEEMADWSDGKTWNKCVSGPGRSGDRKWMLFWLLHTSMKVHEGVLGMGLGTWPVRPRLFGFLSAFWQQDEERGTRCSFQGQLTNSGCSDAQYILCYKQSNRETGKQGRLSFLDQNNLKGTRLRFHQVLVILTLRRRAYFFYCLSSNVRTYFGFGDSKLVLERPKCKSATLTLKTWLFARQRRSHCEVVLTIIITITNNSLCNGNNFILIQKVSLPCFIHQDYI